MQKKTLTLKSTSRIIQQAQVADAITPTCVIAGRSPKQDAKQSCNAVMERLRKLIDFRQPIFIQLRSGTGYCGVPASLEDGWLTMTNVSIHGTKHTATSQEILIQLKDGSFIAHLHAVETQPQNGVTK